MCPGTRMSFNASAGSSILTIASSCHGGRNGEANSLRLHGENSPRPSALLLALGLLACAFPRCDPGTQRILGVLQRIAICYRAAAAIFLYSGVRGQILWIAGLFAAYGALMMLVPAPGPSGESYGRGRLDVEGNFAHYVDRVVLGRHNYAPMGTWDPEGVVSTLPAVGAGLLGGLAGPGRAGREAVGGE